MIYFDVPLKKEGKSMEAFTLYNEDLDLFSSVSLLKDKKGNDPKVVLPTSKVEIYGLDNKNKKIFFNTIEARSRFDDFIGRPITYDYIGTFAGKREVIKVTFEDNKDFRIVTRKDNETYYSLNAYEWERGNKNIWNVKDGNLTTLYHMIGNKAHLEKTLTRIK